MTIGWIRAYAEENSSVGTRVSYFQRQKRAEFRSNFTTPFQTSGSATSQKIRNLKWGDEVELPTGLGDGEWTAAKHKTKNGFVKTKHLVEIGYVKRGTGTASHNFRAVLDYERFDPDSQNMEPAEMTVLWGDLVQIESRKAKRSKVRVRGTHGTMDTADIDTNGLLEVYFVDVGQGDGVLVRTPDCKHILIDAGLARLDQQTGKNAADFVDWKYFFDYGDFRIRLDSLMASHSDIDHYGGLHDLIRDTELADRELDCTGVDIKTFHHPGLSRWVNINGANPPHSDGLGPKVGDGFTRLLGDRNDAEAAVQGANTEKLSGPWGRFIRDILKNSSKTKVERLLVAREDLQSGAPVPKLWQTSAGCEIQVLAPVSYLEGGQTALRDFGVKSKNTNGHSICLRIKYGKSRILLTGDLNTKSMHWLEESYDDRLSLFKCDVAKACHHGSDDISYRFLEAINAAATVISSGDAEGHAHPRPEVTAASACSGHKFVDRKADKLVTPLLYMTEIERSVTIGAINRIDISGMQAGGAKVDGVVLGRPVDELNDKAFLSPAQRKALKGLSKADKKKAITAARETEKPGFEAAEDSTRKGSVRVDFNLTVPLGPVDEENVSKRAWRARLMQKTHYGLVNMRTDGKTVMCATLDETEKKWIIHTFPARFPG